MLEMISVIFPGIFLFIESIRDIRKREISMISVGIFGVLGIVLQLISDASNWYSMLAGALVGVVVLLSAKITCEKIGYGDGWLLVVTGIYLGFRYNLFLFAIALFLSAVVSMVLMVFKKVNRKSAIPFIPFVLGGYCIMLAGVI